MNNDELVKRRIKNMDWPRYLLVCSSLGTTLVFLWTFSLILRLMDAVGLDIEWAEPTYGHFYLKFEAFGSEWIDLIDDADQGKP